MNTSRNAETAISDAQRRPGDTCRLPDRTVPEAWIAGTLLTVLVCLMTAQVFLRFALNTSASWLEEVIRLVFVWAVYASILVAAADDRHIRVAAHLSLLPIVWQKVILAFADLVWIGFNLVVVYAALTYVVALITKPYLLPTTGINLVWFFMIIPIGFLILAIRVALNIRKRWTGSLDILDSRHAS